MQQFITKNSSKINMKYLSNTPPEHKTDVWAFLIESYQRMSLKSPRFFQVWQAIGMAAALITGIPLAIQQFELMTGVQIALPEVVNHWVMRTIFWCGVIVKMMAKFPVTQPPIEDHKEVSKVKALPFTSKTPAEAEKRKPQTKKQRP